jgi:hypothetical protein
MTTSNLPPIPRDQRKIDVEHLKLLSIFHFVGAGLALLGLLFIFAHFMLFQTLINDPQMWQNQKQAPPPKEFFMIFRWFYVFFGLFLVGSLVLNFLSGIFIRARKHRIFSLVIGGFNCIHFPLGTVLGVFTIIVMVRDSVRELYEAEQGAAANP